MKHTLSSIRRYQEIRMIPDGKYEGEWVGTNVYFVAAMQSYIADVGKHQQEKVHVWVRVKDGCATCEVKK